MDCKAVTVSVDGKSIVSGKFYHLLLLSYLIADCH